MGKRIYFLCFIISVNQQKKIMITESTDLANCSDWKTV